SHRASPLWSSAQSMTVRTGVVQGILALTARSPGPRVARWTVAACRRRPLAFTGIVTWGRPEYLARPWRAAAVRWETTVPGGPARQVIIASCCQEAGAPDST